MKKFISLVVVFISVTTVISGLTQIIAPSVVLTFVGATVDSSSLQLFGTIGMFMFLFGAMMLHAVYSKSANPAAIIWSAFQKFGAAIAVGIGVCAGVFGAIALAVALFDLLSGFLIFYYLYINRNT